MIKAIAFDLDGTLVDTEPVWFRIHKDALADYGINLTEKDHIVHYIETSLGTAKILQNYGLESKLEESRKKMKNLVNSRMNEIKLMRGALEAVSYCSKYNRAIVSYNHRYFIDQVLCLSHISLSDSINTIVSYDDVTNHKPHPEPFAKAAEWMGLLSSQCIAIEDSSKGVISAKDAGMFAIAVPNEWTKNLDFSRADIIIEDLTQLPEAISDIGSKIDL